MGQGLEKVSRPINLPTLEKRFAVYTEREDSCYFLNWFTFGFCIPFNDVRSPYMATNLKFLEGVEKVVQHRLTRRGQRATFGLFSFPTCTQFEGIPLDIVP